MENLLSARHKNLIILSLAAFLLGGAVYCYFSLSPSDAHALAWTKSDVSFLEKKLEKRVNVLLRRSAHLYGKLLAHQLRNADFTEKESLLLVNNGVIQSYWGEIYYLRAEQLPVGQWRLINKNQDVFFLRCMAENQYYMGYFINLNAQAIESLFKPIYADLELQFLPEKFSATAAEVFHDTRARRFQISHSLGILNNQLLLKLIFSRESVRPYVQRMRGLVLDLALLTMFLLYAFAIRQRRSPLWTVSRLVVLLLSWLVGMQVLAFLDGGNSFFALGRVRWYSIRQWLLTLTMVLFLLWRKQTRRGKRWLPVAMLFFQIGWIGSTWLCHRVLAGVNFPFTRFELGWNYLSLLAVLFLIFFLPVFVYEKFLRPAECRRPLAWLIGQGIVLLIVKYSAVGYFPTGVLFALIFAISLLPIRRRYFRLPLIFFLSAAAYWLLASGAEEHKREFVEGNLQAIFASQNQYAKLVGREIVYQINAQGKSFAEFIRSCSRAELESIWKNSLAARELIASGIYVLNPNGEVKCAYSYQIPYLTIHEAKTFPFWHVEEVTADLFGKKVALAVASTAVFEREQLLGSIMIQVLNLPELILKNLDQTTVFTIDRKIPDPGFSYIKVDEEKEIVENPGNVNFENLDQILTQAGRWLTFRFTGVAYKGFVFKTQGSTYVIYFPRDGIFTASAEFIRILLFFLVLYLAFYLKDVLSWSKQMVSRSFSLKVFAILILIAMFTALVFFLFSLNFQFSSLEKQLYQTIYERGRTAQNILRGMMAGSNEVSQANLFLLSRIFDGDISVYENGSLLFTSNHRKIIQSEIPIYVNTAVRRLLEENKQEFALVRRGNRLRLYFLIAPAYIYNMEFSYNAADLRHGRQRYLDFIVTVFFFLVLIVLASAFFFRNRILAPIRRLNLGMAMVEKGEMQPLPIKTVDMELKNLYEGFNAMINGIEDQKKSISEIARMKTLVQLGRRVAHEIKNPLTPIKLSAEQIRRAVADTPDDWREIVAKSVQFIAEETEHLRKVSYGFLDLAKMERLMPELFSLGELLREDISVRQNLYPHIRFGLLPADREFPVRADRMKIRHMLRNVLDNAVAALGGSGGEVRVTVGEEGPLLVVSISDTGPGIPSPLRERIFLDDYSSKESGSGLGLIIVKWMAELHGGSVRVSSAENAGTTVEMRFLQNVLETGKTESR